jgi:CheY-like chemotaxis protein
MFDVPANTSERLAVLSWMRKEAGLDIPVVVLTNTAGQQQEDEARHLGVSGFLIKSKTLPRQLTEILEGLTSEPRRD